MVFHHPFPHTLSPWPPIRWWQFQRITCTLTFWNFFNLGKETTAHSIGHDSLVYAIVITPKSQPQNDRGLLQHTLIIFTEGGLLQHTLIIFTEGCRLIGPPPSGISPVSGTRIKTLVNSQFCSNRLLPEKTLITSAIFLSAKSNHRSMSNFNAWNVPGRQAEWLMNILNDYGHFPVRIRFHVELRTLSLMLCFLLLQLSTSFRILI